MKVLKIKESELTCNRLDGGGVPIYYHNGSPFTGIVLWYYDTGELFSKRNIKIAIRKDGSDLIIKTVKNTQNTKPITT